MHRKSFKNHCSKYITNVPACLPLIKPTVTRKTDVLFLNIFSKTNSFILNDVIQETLQHPKRSVFKNTQQFTL